MANLVVTLGTSPGMPYESLLNLCRGRYDAPNPRPVRIDNVYLFHTSNARVVASYMLAKILIECSGHLFPSGEKALPEECRAPVVHPVPLKFDDVDERDKYLQLVEELKRRVRGEDVVDVSGGRASMAVAASMAAARVGAMIVATVVEPKLYVGLANAFTKLLESYDIHRVLEDVVSGGCKALDGHPDFKNLLTQLVTGKAKTFQLDAV